MKSASSALIDYLETVTQLTMADCYTLTLRDGTTLRYTSADVNVSDNGNVFYANSVQISGLKYKIAVGLDVDEQDITIAATSADMVGDVPILIALREGVFDGAYLTRARAFLNAFGQAAIGSVTLFHGRISTIDKIGRTTAQVKVKSDLVLLDISMPRNVWSLGCLHTLYDSGCTLSKSNFQATGAVGAGSSHDTIYWTGISGLSDPRVQGVVLFTSGLNEGVSTTIKAVNTGVFGLSYPLDELPGIGDTFTVWYGCDKTQATCTARFNNVANFRGFPHVPPPETAY